MAKGYNEAADVLCDACDFGPFLRNAYWTGVPGGRRLIAEQRYFMEAAPP